MTDPRQAERSNSLPVLHGEGRGGARPKGASDLSKNTDPTHRTKILTEARRWIGTPFHHRASLCGTGTDCLGLIRGIWRALYGDEPEPLPDYAPDWAEATGREDMLAAALRHFEPVEEARPGDLLLFRLKRNAPARHAGILSFWNPLPLAGGTVQREGRVGTAVSPQAQSLIHAASPHPVAEEPLIPTWQRRITATFAFPSAHLLRDGEAPHVPSSTQPSSCENAASKFIAARSAGSM